MVGKSTILRRSTVYLNTADQLQINRKSPKLLMFSHRRSVTVYGTADQLKSQI